MNNWRKNQWRKKKKKKKKRKTKQWKKKKVKGQKLRPWVPPYVFNYKNVIELWVMKTENI